MPQLLHFATGASQFHDEINFSSPPHHWAIAFHILEEKISFRTFVKDKIITSSQKNTNAGRSRFILSGRLVDE